jgi:hypothetical protein
MRTPHGKRSGLLRISSTGVTCAEHSMARLGGQIKGVDCACGEFVAPFIDHSCCF